MGCDEKHQPLQFRDTQTKHLPICIGVPFYIALVLDTENTLCTVFKYLIPRRCAPSKNHIPSLAAYPKYGEIGPLRIIHKNTLSGEPSK